MTTNILSYYNRIATEYDEVTYSIDMSSYRQHFLRYLPKQASILDAGCGSGRDSKAFLDLGYHVTALDASIKLAHIASEHLGKEVFCKRFDEMTFNEEFDGIWTNATLLHITNSDMQNSMRPIVAALKVQGIWYLSFKYGNEERIVNDILYNHQNEDSLVRHLAPFSNLKIEEMWNETSSDSSFKPMKWLFCITRKTSSFKMNEAPI